MFSLYFPLTVFRAGGGPPLRASADQIHTVFRNQALQPAVGESRTGAHAGELRELVRSEEEITYIPLFSAGDILRAGT